MNGFGKKSAAYICYMIVNLWWYLACIFGAIFPLILIYEYFEDTHPDSFLGMSVPLSGSLVELNKPEHYHYLKIDSTKAQIDFSYVLQNYPDIYILWALFICLILGLFLYGLFQMRQLLKSSVSQAVFVEKNIRRLKIIALLVILIEPLKWIQHHFIFSGFGEVIAAESADLSIRLPILGSDWTFIVVGLLIFALAAVFEKGRDMYQELKLTV